MGKEVEMEQDMFAPDTKKRNPLVLVGALATAGVLAGGLVAFKHGAHGISQAMMRTRVLFQAATVAIMVGSAGVMPGAGGFIPGSTVTMLPQAAQAAVDKK